MDRQDSLRRHPAEELEDTPHVSELDSEDGITPMEVNFPGNQGPLGIDDKVRFFMFSIFSIKNILCLFTDLGFH